MLSEQSNPTRGEKLPADAVEESANACSNLLRKLRAFCCSPPPRNSVIKILLLGMSEVGKTTIVKQMQHIYGECDSEWNPLGGAFTREKRRVYRDQIHTNIFQIISTLVEQNAERYHFEFENPSNIEAANQLMALRDSQRGRTWTGPPPNINDYFKLIRALWNDRAIRSVFEHQNEFSLHNWAEYFMLNLEKMAEQDYVPSHDDVLRARAPTQGAKDYYFRVHVRRDFKFQIKDIGGIGKLSCKHR